MKPSLARAAARKHVILFLAANPRDTGRLALDAEARSIHLELKRSGFGDRFDFVTRWAMEPLDLLRELRELQPTVVHFSGHATRPASTEAPANEPLGLLIHNAQGDSLIMSHDALAQTFDVVGAQVRLVVLNACYSASIAEALLAHVDCIVGMSGAIHDDAARSFAIGFYGALGEQKSIAAAFQQGQAAIRLDGLLGAAKPQLHVRAGFDPAQLVLAAVTPSAVLDVPCPYPGMRPFTVDDAVSFHGRDGEIDDLIDRLRAGEREIYVIGPSGSGKSSLVAAGVLPRLARGVAGLGPCVVRTLRPGDQPAARLSEALERPEPPPAAAEGIAALLAHRSTDSWVLLVIDQLEELFTLAGAGEREAFLAALRTLRAEPRCAVVVTLRADFYGALMESPLWPERGRDQLSRIEVAPLRGEPLREAIAVPAHDVGVHVDPELIERLVADTASEPGTLPLLQETMVQLWNKRTDQALTLADYEALGDGVRCGLAVALARRADATLRRFTPAQTDIARRILLRLISFGEGRSDTRRQQPRAQLRAAGDAAADFDIALQTMVDDRLLTVDEDVTGEPRVDLAHEMMISAWPKLADWIRSHRADEQRRRKLEAAAVEWADHGRTARGLLDPIELADAEHWQNTESAAQLGHSAQVVALIAASRDAQTRQRRRRRRLITGAFTALATFAIVVAVLAIVANNRAIDAREQADEAHRQAERAKASERERQLQLARFYMERGRQLAVEENYQDAVPYLLEARRNGLDSPPLRMLFHAAKRHLPLVPPLVHQKDVQSAAFSADGTRVFTTSYGTAYRWDAATGQPIPSPVDGQRGVRVAAFSSDGKRMITASQELDVDATGMITRFVATAQVREATTGEPLTGPLVHNDSLGLDAVFSPDGARVLTTSLDTARVWDAVTGKPLTDPIASTKWLRRAGFSADGARVIIVSPDETARVWDVATGHAYAGPLAHQTRVQTATLSPGGTRVVTATDKTARVWDAVTGQPVTAPLVHPSPVQSAAFSPEGMRVVTASYDNAARVWDAETGKLLTGPLVHHEVVRSAAFSPERWRVVTASSDHTARVWDAATGQPLTGPFVHPDAVESAAFSPDGTRVVTVSHDKTVRVWDAANSPLIYHAFMISAAFSPDSTRLLTASRDDNTARIWSATTGKLLTGPLTHQDHLVQADFSPDGARVVTVTCTEDIFAKTKGPCSAWVWDAATSKLLTGPLAHGAHVQGAELSPDGTRLVTASDKTARVWDAATGKPLTAPLAHDAEVWSAKFSPDGTRVVTASEDKTARVWDAATGQPIVTLLAHRKGVTSAEFSRDGTRVVTASEDGTAGLWNAATGKPLSSFLVHHGPVVRAELSLDGTRVITASEDATARVWDAATGKPLTGALQHQRSLNSASFSHDGTRVVTASNDQTVRVWDAATGQPLTGPIAYRGWGWTASFSPDGTRVIIVSDKKTVRTWDVGLDTGTLPDWERIAERSPFVLVNGVLMRRSELSSAKPAL